MIIFTYGLLTKCSDISDETLEVVVEDGAACDNEAEADADSCCDVTTTRLLVGTLGCPAGCNNIANL
jgi:hypothetical protein